MKYEKEYISYLISNIDKFNHKYLDDYFKNNITFVEMIESIDYTKCYIQSYNTFVKECNIKKIWQM